MATEQIDDVELKKALMSFFLQNGSAIQDFGSRINQTFEAFVFASVVNWYRENQWRVSLVHPQGSNGFVKLK